MKIWWSLFNPLLATAATCPWPPSVATLPQVRIPHVNSHSRGCIFIALNAVLQYCTSQLSWGTLRKSGGTLEWQMLLWNDTVGISSWVCMRKKKHLPFCWEEFFSLEKHTKFSLVKTHSFTVPITVTPTYTHFHPHNWWRNKKDMKFNIFYKNRGLVPLFSSYLPVKSMSKFTWLLYSFLI